MEHDWNENLEFGDIGEKLAQKTIELLSSNVYQLKFLEAPEFQRSGKDLVLKVCDVYSIPIEVKTRKHTVLSYWNSGPDLLIETVSVVEYNRPGWIFTSEAKILFYGVVDETGDDWLCAWAINLPALRSWYMTQDMNAYPQKTTRTKDSHSTIFKIVPFNAIPDSIVSELKSLETLETSVLKKTPMEWI